MRKFVPLILAVAGFVIMIVATCDYVFNVNDLDTYLFIVGLLVLIAGYVLTMKAVRDESAVEESSGRRNRKG